MQDILDSLKTSPDDETIEQAINRYNQVLTIVLENNPDEQEEIIDQFQLFTNDEDKVTDQDIIKTEEQLNIQFSLDYKDFIKNIGTIKLGKENHYLVFPFKELCTLDNYLRDYHPELIDYFDADEIDISALNYLLVFSEATLIGSEAMCFDLKSYNPNLPTLDIVEFHSEIICQFTEDYESRTCQDADGFTHYMIALIDLTIEQVTHSYT